MYLHSSGIKADSTITGRPLPSYSYFYHLSEPSTALQPISKRPISEYANVTLGLTLNTSFYPFCGQAFELSIYESFVAEFAGILALPRFGDSSHDARYYSILAGVHMAMAYHYTVMVPEQCSGTRPVYPRPARLSRHKVSCCQRIRTNVLQAFI
ncbi:hypothetical protein BDZ91DRAFT_784755, partial [Kalaharituber pfeilii]